MQMLKIPMLNFDLSLHTAVYFLDKELSILTFPVLLVVLVTNSFRILIGISYRNHSAHVLYKI